MKWEQLKLKYHIKYFILYLIRDLTLCLLLTTIIHGGSSFYFINTDFLVVFFPDCFTYLSVFGLHFNLVLGRLFHFLTPNESTNWDLSTQSLIRNISPLYEIIFKYHVWYILLDIRLDKNSNQTIVTITFNFQNEMKKQCINLTLGWKEIPTYRKHKRRDIRKYSRNPQFSFLSLQPNS